MSEHKTAVGKLLASIGGFFVHLFAGAQKGFEEMPADQQEQVIQGVNIAQILKENYTKGETAVVTLIAEKTSLPIDIAATAILAIAKDNGINTTSVQDYLNHLADKIQAGITDNHWNSLWETAAKFAASYLSNGSVNWVTLGMGVIEYVLQTIVKK
jgi:hypothetical protein